MTSIRREGKLLWFEQGMLSGSSMLSPLALAGRTVCATMIAVGKPLPAATLTAIREESVTIKEELALFGATQMKSVLVVRYLGNSSETAKQVMTSAWRHIRPELTGREAVIPRIWQT
jgi:urease accessory protein